MKTSISECSTSSEVFSEALCQVCALPARGKHFGAITCRACSAFFRRADSSKTNVMACKKDGNCKLINQNGWFECKWCRLQKCYEVGMTSTNFQFDRDPISTKIAIKNVPKSFEAFLGRPHCVIFVEPEIIKSKKDLIDCHDLIRKATRIMVIGSESPLQCRNKNMNSLLKLALALQKIDEKHTGEGVKMVTRYGKEEVLSFFEMDFLKATRWFTYFDVFQQLENGQKIQMMSAMWHVWSRLYKLSTAAMGRRRQISSDDNEMMISHGSEYTVMDLTKIEFDFQWCTKYTNEQMQHFIDNTENNFLYRIIDLMVDLKVDDVELAFLMCQACFHYAGQRFQGEIMEVTEKFQVLIANELHEYYVNELKMNNYSGRLSRILKINNRIREDIWKCRGKQEIADVFDVYSIEYSHPEIFKDI